MKIHCNHCFKIVDVVIESTEGPKKRSLDQNEMINALYRQIADQSPDRKFEEIRQQCKLDYGVPIMCKQSKIFCYMWENSFAKLAYEFQLKAMKEQEVTSKMSKVSASEYIDTVIREYSQEGYSLVHPSEVAA